MYGIDGAPELVEEILEPPRGLPRLAPVRIGNAAADQLQLDIYGELIDSVYIYNNHGRPRSRTRSWMDLTRIVDWVCENWDQADEGIWEVRGGRQHFTYSRLMSWVAIERAVRIAIAARPAGRARPAGASPETRSTTRSWSAAGTREKQAFVQHYDDERSTRASSSCRSSSSSRRPTRSGSRRSRRSPTALVSDSLVYRYDVEESPDGLEGDEGTFSICTFWYVEALARAGRVDEARLAFEKMLTYANHLGLYAEEIGPTGEALGNFPQAFTHLALISAGHYLNRALGEQPGWDW